jgi:hypothetical protein
MKIQILSAGIAVAALAAAVASSPAIAQKGKGSLYAFHTFAVVGGCPGLDWHVTVSPEDKIGGFVAWDRGLHMARLEGEVKKDRTFEIDAKEVGGEGRTAVVRGKVAGDYVNLSVSGSGTPCDGDILPVPRAEGGMQGGGG